MRRDTLTSSKACHSPQEQSISQSAGSSAQLLRLPIAPLHSRHPTCFPIYLHLCYNCPATGGIRFERPGSGWIRQLLRFDALASHSILGQTEKRPTESAVRGQRLAPSYIGEPSIYFSVGFHRNAQAGVVGQDWADDQEGWL